MILAAKRTEETYWGKKSKIYTYIIMTTNKKKLLFRCSNQIQLVLFSLFVQWKELVFEARKVLQRQRKVLNRVGCGPR